MAASVKLVGRAKVIEIQERGVHPNQSHLGDPTNAQSGKFARYQPSFSPLLRQLYFLLCIHKSYTRYIYGSVRIRFVLGTAPAISWSPKSKWHDDEGQINEAGKCIRENTTFWTILGDGVRVQACHAAVWIRFRLRPLGRDDHSGVLIGAGGTWPSDWPVRVMANDVSTRVDR